MKTIKLNISKFAENFNKCDFNRLAAIFTENNAEVNGSIEGNEVFMTIENLSEEDFKNIAYEFVVKYQDNDMPLLFHSSEVRLSRMFADTRKENDNTIMFL